MLFSTGLKTAVLTTDSLRAALLNGKLQVYAGPTLPVSPDDPLPGDQTLLVDYTDTDSGGFDLTFEAAVSAGALVKTAAQVWQGAALANGTATWFRYTKTGDNGLLSTTAIRVQGTVGGAGADLFLATTNMVLGVDYFIDAFAIAVLNS